MQDTLPVAIYSMIISLIERGLHMPTVDTISRLCRGLKVTPAEVIRDMDKELDAKSKGSKKA